MMAIAMIIPKNTIRKKIFKRIKSFGCFQPNKKLPSEKYNKNVNIEVISGVSGDGKMRERGYSGK